MPRFALATLNHSPLHDLPTQWEAHLDAAAEAGFDALAPDIFWLRALEAEGFSLTSLAHELQQRGLACMEIAGIAIGVTEATRAELEEHRRYAEILGAEFVNARIVAPMGSDLVDSFAHCAEVFAAVGARIALEFSRGTTLRGIPDARHLLEAAGTTHAGVTLDTWHFFLAESGPDWEALEGLPHAQFANVQLSDGVPYAEGAFGRATMNERRLPGDGGFDFARAGRVLDQMGFDQNGQGAVVVEVLSAEWRARPVAEFAMAAMTASRSAFNRSSGESRA